MLLPTGACSPPDTLFSDCLRGPLAGIHGTVTSDKADKQTAVDIRPPFHFEDPLLVEPIFFAIPFLHF